MDGTTIVNQGYIDGLVAEVTCLRAERNELRATLENIRVVLGGYTDSDLVSLATSVRARCDALNAALSDVTDGQSAYDISYNTGLHIDRCAVILRMVEKP